MGRSGIVENTKMPFGFMGQPLGGCVFTFLFLVLFFAFIFFLFWLFTDDPQQNTNQPQTSRLFYDDFLNVPSKDFHKTNTNTNEAEAGFAVPASLKTANSANPIFKGTLTPIRKFEYAVGFT